MVDLVRTSRPARNASALALRLTGPKLPATSLPTLFPDGGSVEGTSAGIVEGGASEAVGAGGGLDITGLWRTSGSGASSSARGTNEARTTAGATLVGADAGFERRRVR